MTNALLFDCDGVLANTEIDGHMAAFNQMWREQGINYQWSLKQYIELAKIGGGKERMITLANDPAFCAAYNVPSDKEEWWDTVVEWHRHKYVIYKEMITSGVIPPRAGVKRLAEEALDAGWLVAVCSASQVPSVQAVVNYVMGSATAARFAGVFAGDMVKAKKPAPDIYNLTVKKLDLDPASCVVVEDSGVGLQAAGAAGLTCLVTPNALTQNDDFCAAAMVLTSFGEPEGEPCTVLQNYTQADPQRYFTARDLEKVLGDSA